MSNNPPIQPKSTKDKPKNIKTPKQPTSKKPSLWAWIAIATLAIVLITSSSYLLNKDDVL